MICRKIKDITIFEKVAVIDYDDKQVESLFSNEASLLGLSKFFAQKGLGVKLKEKKTIKDDIMILNELVGGKLVIK